MTRARISTSLGSRGKLQVTVTVTFGCFEWDFELYSGSNGTEASHKPNAMPSTYLSDVSTMYSVLISWIYDIYIIYIYDLCCPSRHCVHSLDNPSQVPLEVFWCADCQCTYGEDNIRCDQVMYSTFEVLDMLSSCPVETFGVQKQQCARACAFDNI